MSDLPYKIGRAWAKFVHRNWTQDSPNCNLQATCLVYSGTMIYCRDEYTGECETTLDGRIRTHIQTALGPSKVNHFGVDSIQVSIHSVIWTPDFHVER